MSNYADIDTTNWTPGTSYWTKIEDDDHAGWLYIITLLSFVYVLIMFAIRFFVKWGMYGSEDWALLGSTILAIGQYITVLIACSKGMGKSGLLIGLDKSNELTTYSAAHAYLYILSHCLSKVSTSLLTLRLFENGRIRNQYLSWGLVVASALFGLGGILTITVECPNVYSPTCANRFLRWQIIMALDIISETLLVVVPLILIFDIQISRCAKITVLAVFGVRLGDIVFAAMNLHRIGLLKDTRDLALDIVPAMTWTQTELLWSILAASLPCLKAFMKSSVKGGEDTWRTTNNIYGSGGASKVWGDWGEEQSSTWGKQVMRMTDKHVGEFDIGFRPDNVSHEVEITHPSDHGSNKWNSWISQEKIIKAETRVEIRREGGRESFETL